MQEFPTAEWYMWVDSDAMIVDPTFEIPFHDFGGKDLVAWGNEEQLRAGNALAGMPLRLHACFLCPWLSYRRFLPKQVHTGKLSIGYVIHS